MKKIKDVWNHHSTFFHLVPMSVFLAEKQNRYDGYYSLDIQRSFIFSQSDKPLTLLKIKLAIVLDITSFLTGNNIITETKIFLIDFKICNRIIAANFIKEIIKQRLKNCKLDFLKTSLLIKAATLVNKLF